MYAMPLGIAAAVTFIIVLPDTLVMGFRLCRKVFARWAARKA
jgi:hypothetical protein